MKIKIQANNNIKSILNSMIGIKLSTNLLNNVIKSDKVTKDSKLLTIELIGTDIIIFRIINTDSVRPLHIGSYDLYSKKLSIFNRDKSNKDIQYENEVE